MLLTLMPPMPGRHRRRERGDEEERSADVAGERCVESVDVKVRERPGPHPATATSRTSSRRCRGWIIDHLPGRRGLSPPRRAWPGQSGSSRPGRAVTQARMARCRSDVARGLVPSGFFSGRGNTTRRSAGVPGDVAGLFVATAALLSPLADTMFAWLKQGSGVPATISLSQAAKDLPRRWKFNGLNTASQIIRDHSGLGRLSVSAADSNRPSPSRFSDNGQAPDSRWPARLAPGGK